MISQKDIIADLHIHNVIGGEVTNMTFDKLSELIEINDIPYDVRLMSDSGWECDPTDMNGVYYNEKYNTIVFTQEGVEWETNYQTPDWKMLWSRRYMENNNGILECNDDITLCPIKYDSAIESLFKEELKRTGEFEDYYGMRETDEAYSEISLTKPLFYAIQYGKSLPLNLIGYIGFDIEDDSCDLEIYIFNNYRNKGYGKLALTTLLEQLTHGELSVFNCKSGTEETYTPKCITASVRTENEAGNALVKACGFQQDDDIAAMFFVPAEPENRLDGLVKLQQYKIILDESKEVLDGYGELFFRREGSRASYEGKIR